MLDCTRPTTLLLLALNLSARDYYLSATGNDTANGTKQAPWRTLARASNEQLRPGDRLLLQGGQTVEGTLVLDQKHSGTAPSPVVVTSSGTGTAIIDGGKQAAVTVTGTRWLTIRNLDVRGAGRLTGNTTSGISISGAT